MNVIELDEDEITPTFKALCGKLGYVPVPHGQRPVKAETLVSTSGWLEAGPWIEHVPDGNPPKGLKPTAMVQVKLRGTEGDGPYGEAEVGQWDWSDNGKCPYSIVAYRCLADEEGSAKPNEDGWIDEDGWIEWTSVDALALPEGPFQRSNATAAGDVKLRNGAVLSSRTLSGYRWTHIPHEQDIIAYRVTKIIKK